MLNIEAQEYPFEQISPDDLISIYELTYKRQILQQEERLGDYGIGKTLPDKVYMELSRIDGKLKKLLDESLETALVVFESWVDAHMPGGDVSDESVAALEDVFGPGAYTEIPPVLDKLKTFSTLNVSKKIVLFQEALTVAHNTGTMAEYLIRQDPEDLYMIKLLDDLSSESNPYKPKWDQDLIKLLGHPPGSTIAPKEDVWIQPASKRLGRVIQVLRRTL